MIPLTKAASERRHFRRRMREHYGLRLNREDVRAIEARVRRGEYRLVLRQSGRVSVLALYWGEIVIVLAWDGDREAPITALERGAWMYSLESDGLPGVPARIVLRPGADGYSWSPNRKFSRPNPTSPLHTSPPEEGRNGRPPQGGGGAEGPMGGGAKAGTRPGQARGPAPAQEGIQ